VRAWVAALLLLTPLLVDVGPLSASQTPFLGKRLAKRIVHVELADRYASFRNSPSRILRCPKRLSRSRFRCETAWLHAPSILAAMIRVTLIRRTADGPTSTLYGRGIRYRARCVRQSPTMHLLRRCVTGRFRFEARSVPPVQPRF
jgi:hypothetical protein